MPNRTFCNAVRYTQSNGYKPQPLDLSAIRLSSRLETLVDELAENTHNIWAKDRIHQGWTYGSTEVEWLVSAKHVPDVPLDKMPHFQLFKSNGSVKW